MRLYLIYCFAQNLWLQFNKRSDRSSEGNLEGNFQPF